MMPYTNNLNRYGDSVEGMKPQEPLACADVPLIEIAREEYAAVTGLIDVLKQERKAILSLSLKDITGANTEKENIVKTMAVLRERRSARIACMPGSLEERQDEEYLATTAMIKLCMREARTYLRKNGALLSLSAGRVKSTMEFIERSLKSKSATYGRDSNRDPVFFARRV